MAVGNLIYSNRYVFSIGKRSKIWEKTNRISNERNFIMRELTKYKISYSKTNGKNMFKMPEVEKKKELFKKDLCMKFKEI